MIKSIENHEGQWESLEELMAERADEGIRRAFEGFGISYSEALEIIRNADGLTEEEQRKREILVAAVDNICDFAVVEEFHMLDDIEDVNELMGEENEDYEFDSDLLSELYASCRKYNHNYTWVEDMDIEYAMGVAAYLNKMANDTVLMYMTMGDERVRPWHLQYEGYTAPRSQFPGWLIPPIEHGCRCYLVEELASSVASIKAYSGDVPQMPDWFDRTFKESVANGGRIFSDEHPYFQIDESYKHRLVEISNQIKERYFNANTD